MLIVNGWLLISYDNLNALFFLEVYNGGMCS